MYYTPTTHPALLPSTALLCTQLKHCWQNGTRCRDGLFPSCLSGFWRVPSLHALVFIRKTFFVTLLFIITVFQPSNNHAFYTHILLLKHYLRINLQDRGNLQTKDERPVPKCSLFRGLTVSTVYTSLVPRCGEGGGEKGAPGVYCTRMWVNFQKFLENPITSGHLHYTDFCEVADFYCVEDAYHNHALCEWWWGSNENTQLFGCKNDPRVCPFQLNAMM